MRAIPADGTQDAAPGNTAQAGLGCNAPERMAQRLSGAVKWFDSGKGFGFVTDADGGGDVLLHGNVLRKFGRGSVVEGTQVEGLVAQGPRGRQMIEVLALTMPVAATGSPMAELSADCLARLPQMALWPARVKWFDKAKGFGFANVFGHTGDVFIHIEVLRQAGLLDLSTGEAVAMRIVQGDRGLMAAQIVDWEDLESCDPVPLDNTSDVGIRAKPRHSACITTTGAMALGLADGGGPVTQNALPGATDCRVAPHGAEDP